MKSLIVCFVLSSIQLFSQSYLNVLFADGSYKNSQISTLQKITLSTTGEEISFHQTDGTTIVANIADIQSFTLDAIALGEPLPVELTSFNISLAGSSVLLRWRTETEVNNYGFEIERASSSATLVKEWKNVGFIKGSGNSSTFVDYSFTDKPAMPGIYYYRLKQIDLNGNLEYSSIVSIEIYAPNQYSLNQNHPNPFNPTTQISYCLPTDGFVTLKVFDIMGSELVSLINENLKAGSYTATFDASKYASGIYICRISAGNYSSSIKMILMK